MLADLLDSTPYSACGPELEFFCNKCIYEFSDYQSNPHKISSIHSIRATGIRFREDHLAAYNLTRQQWDEHIQQAASLQDFTASFARAYLTYRGKPNSGIVFEKTPQNINAIDLFLTAFPNSYFIHIVRDPASVYWSLRKRGWGELSAWSTWLIYEAKYFPFIDHPRCITLKYRDLVQRPFQITADIINRIAPSAAITADMVKSGFKENRYRQQVSSIQGWSNTDRTTIQATVKAPPTFIKEKLSNQLDCHVDPAYADRHGLSTATLREIMEKLNYHQEVEKLAAQAPDTIKIPTPTFQDWRKILPKWIKSIWHGNGQIKDLHMLTKPIVPAH